jgi:hypothetical protein
MYVNDPDMVYASVSVGIEDFAPNKLICLAEKLKNAHMRENVEVDIYSSFEAALGPPMPMLERSAENLFKVHAKYVYDHSKHEGYLLIIPDGIKVEDTRLTTRINLPVSHPPPCTLHIEGRCLLEFEHIYYPFNRREGTAQGQVTVTATIQKDGATNGVLLADAKIAPADRQAFLVNWAKKNLATWRFEPTAKADKLRITYYFDDRKPGRTDSENCFEFHLPNEVRIHPIAGYVFTPQRPAGQSKPLYPDMFHAFTSHLSRVHLPSDLRSQANTKTFDTPKPKRLFQLTAQPAAAVEEEIAPRFARYGV